MAYQNTIPQPTDILSISQADILEDFAQIESQFSIDHDSLLPAGASGKHMQVTLPEHPTNPTTLANEGAVYSRPYGLNTALFFRTENNGNVYLLNPVTAFVIFDGATGAILEGERVASVTRTAVGTYTVNLTPGHMATTNYGVSGGIKGVGGSEGAAVNESATVARTLNTYYCTVAVSGTGFIDPPTVQLLFFGGLN